jgi:hypothetical protein
MVMARMRLNIVVTGEIKLKIRVRLRIKLKVKLSIYLTVKLSIKMRDKLSFNVKLDIKISRGGHAQFFLESAIAIPQFEGSTSAIATLQLLKKCCFATATPQFRNRNCF